MDTGTRLLFMTELSLQTTTIRESLMFQEVRMQKEQEFNGTRETTVLLRDGESNIPWILTDPRDIIEDGASKLMSHSSLSQDSQ
jgi:hypothetical protein